MDPVEEIYGRLDRFKLIGWMAFAELEPFAADRADLRDAMHTALLCDLLLPGSAPPVSDLIPDWQALSEPGSAPAAAAADPIAEADAILLQIQTRFPLG